MKAKKPETKISLHGRTFSGIVTSRKMQKTAKVEWDRTHLIKKYERYEKRKSSVMAHVPDKMEVKEGDRVIVKECRPLSKTKHFIIVKNESN
ncbi:MAG: 30S ribosomal protein S17 [Nanoarchaeota archaeon]|jgi:small subunit ribosomal protein S17|nr:30S ribosomal protein S17 [Nanoarchaeota archaeon]|tara:strand:- start:27572 stop:27847 length:276 start_codon:yes stop_codon:yes gene_type:complete